MQKTLFLSLHQNAGLLFYSSPRLDLQATTAGFFSELDVG